MKTKTGIMILLAAAVAVAGGWYLFGLRSGVPVATDVVKVGPIEEFIIERGKTRLPRTYLITMPSTGRIEPITLEEGSPVKSGQTVARMVPLDLELDVAEATAAVERLEKAIAENDAKNVEETALQQAQKFVVSMRETVKAAYERVLSGQAEYDYAEKNFGRVAPLAAKGVNTQDELDQAELLKIQSAANYRQDQLVYSAMNAMEAATNLMPTMIEQYIGNKSLSSAVLQKQLAEAAARQRQIVEDQHRGTMASPIDGVVLQRFVTNEQYLTAGTQLLELGRLRDMEIEADVLTVDAVDVKVNDPVEIFGPAVGRPPARGRVTRVYPAGFTKISSLGVEQQRVKVIVAIDPQDRRRLLEARHVEVGYRVHVKIITDRKTKALVLPRTALFRGGQSQWQVFVVRDGRARIQDVQIGLLNDQWAEVTNGLAEGDCGVVAPESTLTDGTRVTTEPQP